ncbi:MAG: hypothetical protein A4E73_03965 [Syntrophaceae bacterium PtaU1.Bin231]|nr:MAG: hypothetical protein A4E73_03965 [Syntrophaceae bacterium PtaU1.Bin231]HOG18610.1 hypothetical protein [Syntrophales bacterium]
MKKRRSIALLAACVLLMTSAPAFGDERVDDMAMVADVLFVRPVGIAAIVLGTALFIVSMPFAIPSGSVGKAGQMLVAEPFRYTFCRPLGDFDDRQGGDAVKSGEDAEGK